ncbi:MAG: phosphate/phosphite/phosphonate ABC transporter substrate-binding protein [Gammaproteobacteria bacterium]|nr:phosphate/phosphite/phosphonate ABC transporter substrate-binding protein [Gammaproteobacteria bacterium]
MPDKVQQYGMHQQSLSNTFKASGYLLLALALLLSCHLSFAHETKLKHLKLGVYPHLSEKHLVRGYKPIAKRLSEATGTTILFDASDNLENFRSNLENQQYDIVMLQPFDYVEFADRNFYEALATLKTPLTAVFAVKESSKLEKIYNLLGRDVYFPPSSTAVSYLAKHLLINSGIDINKDLNIYHERTHLTCLQKLIFGLADSCVTARPVIQLFEEKLGVKLKIIAESQAVPNMLFAVKPTLPKNLKQDLLTEIISWKKNGKHGDLLDNARLQEFKPISDKDYNIVRKIKNEMSGF